MEGCSKVQSQMQYSSCSVVQCSAALCSAMKLSEVQCSVPTQKHPQYMFQARAAMIRKSSLESSRVLL